MIDGGQGQRWLEDEVPSKKPRVSKSREKSGLNKLNSTLFI